MNIWVEIIIARFNHFYLLGFQNPYVTKVTFRPKQIN